MESAPYFLGVDLGGTQLRMAGVRPDGSLATDVLSVPTGTGFGPADLQRRLPELGAGVRARLGGQPAAALGFGTAGVVGNGPLSQCDNLPLLNGVDVERLVRDAVGCPVALENDARCFTLAEARFGAARGARDVCGLTLGTGVGCGLLVGGRLHHGSACQAGEVWRVPVRGQPLESFLSGAGVVRGYASAGGRPEAGLDAERVADLARCGDTVALAAWRAFGDDLAGLCAFVIALLDPAVVVIGGSLSRAADLYRPVVASHLEGDAARIVAAELGAAAGVIGAAALNIP
jgi:glucokinase